jgi:hypothetical protein
LASGSGDSTSWTRSNPLDIACFAKYRANFANYFVHLQRGCYNGVARADSQLPGTAIQIVFVVCSYRWRGNMRHPRILDNQTFHSSVNNDNR